MRFGVTRSIVTLFVALFLFSGVGLAAAQGGSDVQDEKQRATSNVRFYGHVFGHGLDGPMPANTQFPTGENNYGLGTFDWCTPAGGMALGEVPDPAHNCDDDPNNKLAFYSTAGFVQVSSGSEFTGGGGYVQLHNERGSTKDIIFDTTGTVTASLFLSQDFHAWSVNTGETYCTHPHPRDSPCVYPYWGWDPGMAEGFVVEANLYHAPLGEYGSAASEAPPVREALESGAATLIASGKTQPTQVINGVPGYPNVHKFDVDLGTPLVDVMPKEDDFFLVYSIYSTSGENKYSLHTWRFWSGEFFPPTFSMPVKNAFDVEGVVPQFVHGKLAILGIINTPWGSYDVDPTATVMTITDANGKEIEPVRIDTLADYSVAHGAHYKPVNVTFVWDYVADKLPAGTYTVSITAANIQRSGSAECTAEFTIQGGGKPGSIVPGLCGLQTGQEHRNQVGDDSAPGASPTGGADGRGASQPEPAGAVNVPPIPVLGLAGLALFGRRWVR